MYKLISILLTCVILSSCGGSPPPPAIRTKLTFEASKADCNNISVEFIKSNGCYQTGVDRDIRNKLSSLKDKKIITINTVYIRQYLVAAEVYYCTD